MGGDRSTVGSGSLAGQLERVIEDAGNAADAAEERHAQSASAAVANAVDGGVVRGANGQGESVVMAELETVVRTGSNNQEEVECWCRGGENRRAHRWPRQPIHADAPHDLTVPHQDVGLIEELLITLSTCFLMGGDGNVGLPSFSITGRRHNYRPHGSGQTASHGSARLTR